MMHDKKPDRKVLGKGRKLVDGLEKVTGRARYAGDVGLPGMLYARPVLSPYAHARIQKIDKSAALAIPGVVAVLSAEDLKFAPAASRPGALLARGETVFAGQPVAVVIARSEAQASDGALQLEIDYDPLESVADPQHALDNSLLIWPKGLGDSDDMASLHGGSAEAQTPHAPSNIQTERSWGRGDVQKGFAEAAVTVEHSYSSAWVHQGYLEPHATVAEPDGRGGVTVYTTTQGQYAVRGEVSKALGLKPHLVHVVPMIVGGAFGAKYGIYDPLVAALALKLGRPVKMVLTRSEDFQSSMPSPGNSVWLKTAANASGDIVAIQADVVVDIGTYPFGFAGIFANALGGLYKCPNVDVHVREVYTHKLAAGAYRAPVTPHAVFALEGNIDDMAKALGIDPLEFRLKNAVEEGDPMGSNRPWPNIGLKQCLEAVRDHPLWKNRQNRPNEGIGIAIGGWPGAFSPAGAVCRIEPDGTARLHVGSVDISGVHSSLVLITAETLGIDPERVELVQGTTDSGPFAPASGGSQVTVSVAGAVQEASQGVRLQLLKLAGEHFEVHPDDLELEDGKVKVKGVPEKAISIGELAGQSIRKPGGPGPIQAEGRAAMKAGAPGFTAHMVRVHVDPDSGHVTLLDYVNAQDVGFALNPTLVEGQMHGGSVQGLGIGLFEAVRFDSEGNHASANLLEYAMPRALDVPNIQTILVENPSEHGPFGARIVGEPPITAGAAAVANAIHAAVGVRMTELPISAQAVWNAMQKQG